MLSLKMSVAAGALLAAMAIGGAAAAADQTSDPVNENGARGAPLAPVDVTVLPAAAKPGKRPVVQPLAEPPAVELAASEPKRLAGAAEPAPSPRQASRLTLQLVDAPAEVAAAPSEQPDGVAEEFSEEAAVMGHRAVAHELTEQPPAENPAVLMAAADQAPAAADAGEPAAARSRRRVAEAPADDAGPRQHVAFPKRSAEAAGAFVRYMHDASAIDPKFKDASGVVDGLKTAAGYDVGQLTEGMVAYGAMAALQSAPFVYAVMDQAADPRSRRALMQQILADPTSVTRLAGASDAAAMADAAILSEAQPLVDNGQALKQAAYDVQHQAWSGARATDQTGRLARAKAASAIRISVSQDDLSGLLGRLSTVSSHRMSGAPFTSVSTRSVGLAALAILGEDSDADGGGWATVAGDPTSAQCLKMSKLNLFQCLSVAGPEYEDVYCMGQHGVLDTAKCVAGAAKPSGLFMDAALSRGRRATLAPASDVSRSPGLE